MKKKLPIALKSGRPSTARSQASMLSRLAAPKNLKRVNFQLDSEDHRRLKIYAAEEGKTITTLLKQHIVKLITE